jgi:proteic killer suppression protein
VIKSFGDKGTEDIYDGMVSASATKRCPKGLWSIARRKLDLINRAMDLNDLSVPPGNRLEKLKGDRKGQLSIRINNRFRICFRWENGEAHEVEIADYH